MFWSTTKKHETFKLLALGEGIHTSRVHPFHQAPVMRKPFPSHRPSLSSDDAEPTLWLLFQLRTIIHPIDFTHVRGYLMLAPVPRSKPKDYEQINHMHLIGTHKMTRTNVAGKMHIP